MKFGVLVLLTLLFILWTDFIILIVLFPLWFETCFVKRVPWKFWWRLNIPFRIKELLDALFYAVVCVWFISTFLFEIRYIATDSMEDTIEKGDVLLINKLELGPRLPVTPLSFPFHLDTIPGTTWHAYSSAIRLNNKRLKGFNKKVKRNGFYIFNLPVRDTIAHTHGVNYYQYKRKSKGVLSEDILKSKHYVPLDKRKTFTKRLVGLPGDTILIKAGYLYVNSAKQKLPFKHKYLVKTKKEADFNSSYLDRLGIDLNDILYNEGYDMYEMYLSKKQVSSLDSNKQVLGIQQQQFNEGSIYNYSVFPYHRSYLWTEDNFGPLIIPKAGDTIYATADNWPIYKRLLKIYEQNLKDVKLNYQAQNNLDSTQFILKENYYFAIGDNFHNSYDSRHWGFLPENHIIGEATRVLYSVNIDQERRRDFRWKRFLKKLE